MNLFNKTQRLLKKTDYEQVFEDATKLVTKDFIVFYRRNDLGHPRLGLSLTKRRIPKATQRNRIKRLIREAYRLCHDLPAVDLIFMAKSNLSKRSNHELFFTLGIVWQNLIKK